MALFANHVNLGVNELWYNALKEFAPYEDRLRSTNVREFTRDTTLDVKAEPLTEPKPPSEEKFVLDTKLSSTRIK